MTRLMPRRNTPALLMAMAGLVALASPALAQHAVGDGHALDANLQVGSDGRNTAVRDVQEIIRFNEAIITGNAPYGRSFRGNVGYLASGDFRASLGSNDLFIPLRESAQSSLFGGGIRGTDALQYQFSLVTGAPPPPVLSGIGGGRVDRSVTATPTPLLTSGTLRSTASYLASQALRPSLIGYRLDDDGEPLALTASPLTGVRQIPLRVSDEPLETGQQEDEGATPGGVFDRPPAREPSPLLSGLEPTQRGVRDVLSTSQALSRIDTARTSRADQPPEADATNPFTRALERATGQLEATGVQLDSMLLDRLRRRLRGELRPGEADPLALVPRPQQPETEPGQEQRREDEFFPGSEDDMDAQAALMRALRETRVSVERLGDEAVPRPAAYRAHMAAGQTLLAQERFFDAEDRFMRALSASPNDLMATLGRIHAQLGAGLYLSAASNLRRTLTEHPEIVTAQYGAELLPSAERQVEIISQLRDHVSGRDLNLAEDSALLLAYLGHHAGNTEAMREGLSRLEQLTPADDAAGQTLLALLRGAWQD